MNLQRKDSDEKTFSQVRVWSPGIENVIKGIGETCQGYKWMNLFAAKKAKFRYDVLMYVVIVIGPISGILTTIATIYDTKSLLIPITIFSFISGVFSSIVKFSRFEQRTATHKAIATKYASLENNIRRNLSLLPEDRVSAGEYLEWVSNSSDELFTAAPLIPDEIYDEWVEYAKKNHLTVPEKVAQTIEIATTDRINTTPNLVTTNSEPNPDQQSSEQPNVEQSVSEQPDQIDIVVQGSNTIRRQRKAHEYNPSIDLSRYSDAHMNYELRRLFKK